MMEDISPGARYWKNACLRAEEANREQGDKLRIAAAEKTELERQLVEAQTELSTWELHYVHPNAARDEAEENLRKVQAVRELDITRRTQHLQDQLTKALAENRELLADRNAAVDELSLVKGDRDKYKGFYSDLGDKHLAMYSEKEKWKRLSLQQAINITDAVNALERDSDE